MAFYFALLNVSKKDDRSNSSNTSSRDHRKHRRHSIASVESPLMDYRLLPRPQLLNDDIVITNELAFDERLEISPRVEPQLTRRSRGSAKASKWIRDHQTQNEQNGPSSSRSHNDLQTDPKDNSKQQLSRSKRMAFVASNSVVEAKKKEDVANKKKEKEVEKRNGSKAKNGQTESGRQPSRLPIRKVPARQSRTFSPPSNGLKPICRVHVERALHITRQLPNPEPGSATDDSRRSSAMSNDSRVLRRDDSPASSYDGKNELNDVASTSGVPPAMKLSGVSMSSRSSEPRLKKVTFESSPYVISNSFLGDRAVLVRRGSGTAVCRMLISDEASLQAQNTKVLAPHDEVSGGDWWTPCDETAKMILPKSCIHSTDNRANEQIEKSHGKTCLRRLIRRRSTSDKTRILAYKNTGFLSSSQERSKDGSRMSSSVDRPVY